MALLFRCMVAILVALTTGLASAQSRPEERLKFDVVSVKQNKSGDATLQFDVQPGRLVAVNMPLKQFIRAAFTLQLYQIADAPSWTDAERFDITAITSRDLSAPVVWTPGTFAPLQVMMQSILADRFKMVAHTEQREALSYALVLRSGNNNGQLVPAQVLCAQACGMKISPGTVTARNVPLPQFAELLSQLTGRLVVDATGLTGSFDFEARWTPESQQVQPTGNDAPSLFTAIQEQLGLRLESRRAPVPMLVIDSIDRPEPD